MRLPTQQSSFYLAALHLIEAQSANEASWRKFLDEAKNKPGTLRGIKGFLLAVRDCCIIKGPEANVPGFVAEELGQLAGLDLEALKREQQKRRIRHLISDLSRPDLEDRVHAALALGKIGPAAGVAVSALRVARSVFKRVYSGSHKGGT